MVGLFFQGLHKNYFNPEREIKMTLKELEIGKTADIISTGGEGALRQHFLDMGLIPGAEVTMVKFAPMGDPLELKIHGYELTLRVADADKIEINNIRETEIEKNIPKKHKAMPHPGLGEGGRYHIKADEHPLPKGQVLEFALAGNQNCGKTTLFNRLTGSNQHVGNFPGVTVDRKSGVIKGHTVHLLLICQEYIQCHHIAMKKLSQGNFY